MQGKEKISRIPYENTTGSLSRTNNSHTLPKRMGSSYDHRNLLSNQKLLLSHISLALITQQTFHGKSRIIQNDIPVWQPEGKVATVGTTTVVSIHSQVRIDLKFKIQNLDRRRRYSGNVQRSDYVGAIPLAIAICRVTCRTWDFLVQKDGMRVISLLRSKCHFSQL